LKEWFVSHVTWATYVPILVFSSLSSGIGLDARDRQKDVRHAWLLCAPTLMAGTITKTVNRVITGVFLLVGKRLFPH